MVNKVDIVSNMLERDLEEGLLKVFLALDVRTLAACSLVCKGWSLFLRQRVWRNQVVRFLCLNDIYFRTRGVYIAHQKRLRRNVLETS